MNPDLAHLQAYPFERLKTLKAGIAPPANLSPIFLSIGAPKHPAPEFIKQALIEHINLLELYPATKAIPELRQAIQNWLCHRFNLSSDTLDIERNILPVTGTREALFAIAQTIVDPSQNPVVMMPNPFYQIYEGAALLSHAQPYYLSTTSDNHYQPDYSDVPDDIWKRCQLLFVCTPGNPTGAVMSQADFEQVLTLAEKHDFIVASDECYSELYPDETNPPLGLLEAAHAMGNDTYKRCIAFNSLSKRSNVPGLRSGFVAGDADIIDAFYQYRTYHGCTLSIPAQHASIAAWQDEAHVLENRDKYRTKFEQVLAILSPVIEVSAPDASFYLWPKTPIDDTKFAQHLFASQNVTTLPGQYLSRSVKGFNPGQNRLRLALVATEAECLDAANRIKSSLETL
ncbi:MAG: succinyldiaminopimelate transaminase [Methylococcales bacterium]|jgi:N-succinyldiaminopimelate aminotransferase|nr:succinyldiaminopimelate transaminase [Methylococcales bacterium]MBT7443605.1 succinyldiaminopimelate transaminase [Methylococcales bacterium]